MKTNLTTTASSALARLIQSAFTAALLSALLLLLTIQSGHAGSAQWNLEPVNGDWNLLSNWTPATVPNGPADVATFSASNIPGVSVTALTEVDQIIFNAAASAFTITIAYDGGFGGFLSITGAGIINNSSVPQQFTVQGGLEFRNSASAGTANIAMVNGLVSGFYESSTAGNGNFTVGGASGGSGSFYFRDNATAGNGSFTVYGFFFCGSGSGSIAFLGNATAGNGSFTLNGGAICGSQGGGVIQFDETSTAANGVFTINGGANSGELGGLIIFLTGQPDASPSAGNAILVANGGMDGAPGGAIQFSGYATGGTSRVELFGNGSLDSSSSYLSLIIGSLEGTGEVFLGQNLTVGSNNLSTTFSGIIHGGGSLTKIGTGTLTLSGANIYTGVTTLSAGTLLVNTKPSSGTGTNKLNVNAGTLGGTGTIGGAVTVGTGSGSGAFLAPGTTSTGTLTLKKGLTFKADGTYKFQLKSSTSKADKVTAKGATIKSGALFSFVGLGTGTLTPGTVFTVINNTATTAISGTFSNLANGSIFAVGSNNYQASYTGGSGNDLTLTVVP